MSDISDKKKKGDLDSYLNPESQGAFRVTYEANVATSMRRILASIPPRQSVSSSPDKLNPSVFAHHHGARRTAFVLSGGGARGAYEVGVLHYIFQELTRLRRGKPPRIDILCGTSIGAVNACFLAAHAEDLVQGTANLVNLWQALELPKVLGFGVRQAVSLPRLIFGGGGDAAGLFDVKPMAELVEREVKWGSISHNLEHNHLGALSISTTEVSTGRTVIWMQTGPTVALPATAPPRTVIRSDVIGVPHALASAAIPLLFPPVRLGNEFYCDGGLRLNTPMAPALRLGATHVLAVALSREVRGVATTSETGTDPLRPLGAVALLGKVLNAFLLDHVVNDLDVLARINAFLSDGIRTFGDEFLTRISATAQARGAGEAYRPVHCLALKPTEDIGRMAGEHVLRGKYRGNPLLAKQLLKLLYAGGDTDADLASYLLFDGEFARKLIDLGRADAAARRDELLAFFEEEPLSSEGRDSIEPGILSADSIRLTFDTKKIPKL